MLAFFDLVDTWLAGPVLLVVLAWILVGVLVIDAWVRTRRAGTPPRSAADRKE